MKIVFFDLGNTLEFQDILLPGAMEMLRTIKLMNEPGGNPVVLGLISDYYMAKNSEEIHSIQQKYYEFINILGISSFFDPVQERVTLSTEVGVFKPEEKIFRYAIDKISKGLEFQNAIFITERFEHVQTARDLKMNAIYFKSPGSNDGEVDQLLDLIPLIEEFLDIPSPRALLRKDRRTMLSLCHAPKNSRRSYADPGDSIAAPWAKFGDEVVLITDKADWGGLAGEAGRSSTDITNLGISSKRENLYLVIQKGNLFEKENPDINILFDRGRFLIVEIEPSKVQALKKADLPCYELMPLKDNDVVYEKHPQGSLRRAPGEKIQTLIKQISLESFKSDLDHLTSFKTRHTNSQFFKEATFWARDILSSGYITRTQNITVSGISSQNIIAEKIGNHIGSKYVVLVVAHLDSINLHGDTNAVAPGAGENGSGSAGLLQIARIMQNSNHQNDLRFILFTGEEQGLFGSKEYVNSLSVAERSRIKAVINMDMIGSQNNSTEMTALLEGSNISLGILNRFKTAADTYTALGIKTSLKPFASDHVPFIRANIPAVLTIEGADSSNHFIHTAHDTRDKIDYDLAMEILKMNLAFIASEVGLENS